MTNNQTKTLPADHKLELNSRKDLKMTGILEVVSATATEIYAKTECGPIIVTGNNLKVKSLLIDERILEVDGEITKIEYTKGKKNFLQKLFK